MRSVSYKKTMKAQNQKSQFSKWKISRPWCPVVMDGSQRSAFSEYITSKKPRSHGCDMYMCSAIETC